MLKLIDVAPIKILLDLQMKVVKLKPYIIGISYASRD